MSIRAIRSFLSLLVVASTLVGVHSAHAAPLLTGFGGPGGYGSSVLPGNDDGSSSVIDISTAFPGGLRFFGSMMYTTAYVNNNGNITFGGALGTFTPAAFPVASRPMIAPYWADVDTRGGGAPSRNGVYWHLEPGRMIVTWHNVGYYYQHDDKQMDFQLILTNALSCGSGDFNVEFRYNMCDWTTGDASDGMGGFGGTPAQAGFDAGDSVNFVEIPGSRTMDILNLCTMSNVGAEPGVWRFGVRGGVIECPGAGAPCTIDGEAGACAAGITQCVGREIVCSPIGAASAERCDGIDNDCDDIVDGEGLCMDGKRCVYGECVDACFEGGCNEGQTCTEDGVCVETACIGVECDTLERCRGGECIPACEGVVCPHSQQCVAGRCTDLCDVLVCDEGEVCVDGACIAQCPCNICQVDEICGADGACTPIGCDIVVCDAGFYCDDGECQNACDGAVCPDGQHCEVGECVEGDPVEPTDGGVGPGEDGGTGPLVDGGVIPVVDGGAEVDAGGGLFGRRSSGCGCDVPGTTNSTPWFGLIGLMLALGAVRLARRKASK